MKNMTNQVDDRIPLSYCLDGPNSLVTVEVRNSLSSEDFAALSCAIDLYYAEHGKLNGIIINAKKFPYWKNLESFKAHIAFVKSHHYKINKVAITMNGLLPKILPKLAKKFIQPEVRNFGYDHIDEAKKWIV